MDISPDKLKELLNSDKKILVEFYAQWCGPCKVLKPVFEEIMEKLENEGNETKLYTFDVDTDIELSMSLGIRSVPVIKGFYSGKEVKSKIGITSKEEITKMATIWGEN